MNQKRLQLNFSHRACEVSALVVLAIPCLFGSKIVFAEQQDKLPPASSPSKWNAPPEYDTPYFHNPALFRSKDEAIEALNSSDIQMRRSGVEYLGRWTVSDGSGGTDPKVRRAMLTSDIKLVPLLIRAVRELPKLDKVQASRLLGMYGKTARFAIPAVCAALSDPVYGEHNTGNDDVSAKDDLLSSIAHLSGGLDSLAPTLIGLLYDSDPETQRNAAWALGYCDRAGMDIIAPSLETEYHLSTEDGLRWSDAFMHQVIPALAASVNDPAPRVGAAAANALAMFSYYYPEAPWQNAVKPLVKAASSSDHDLRLAAVEALACLPADISEAAFPLRASLRGYATERSFALVALSRSAEIDRIHTVDVFVKDLQSQNLSRRRRAAEDLSQSHVAVALYCGVFKGNSDEYPAGHEWDSRLWRTFYPAGISQYVVNQQRSDRTKTARENLIAALSAATKDPDLTLSQNAGLGLEQIGKIVDLSLGAGIMFTPEQRAQAEEPMIAVLMEASNSLMTRDLTLAQRLQKLSKKISQPHEVF